jgi:hypothetical protein
MYSVNFKKKTEQHAAQAPALRERIYPSKFDSAESFDSKLTTEGLVAGCGSVFDTAELVAGCGSFVLKSIKRSVINIQRSMLDVRCSTFKAFSPPLEDSLFRPV